MSSIYGAVNSVIENGQSYLNSHIPEIPKDAVKGILRSSACSFAVSFLLSKGNPAAAIVGGSLAALGTVVDIAFMTGINNLQTYACKHSSKPKEAIPFGICLSGLILGWGSALYLGKVLGVTNNKASFLLMLPLFLWQCGFADSTKTPVMGIVVVR